MVYILSCYSLLVRCATVNLTTTLELTFGRGCLVEKFTVVRFVSFSALQGLVGIILPFSV
jgi:hypothetical protein